MSSFEVLGADQRVLVNDTLKTSVLVASGNPTLSNFIGYFHYYGGSAGRAPVVGIWGSPGIYCSIVGVDWVNSHWQITVYSSDQTKDASNNLVNVFVYVYDIMYGSTSTFGLQAMTASGEITFDALKKTLRVIKTNIPYTAPSHGALIPNAPAQPGGKRYGWIAGVPAVSGSYRYDPNAFGSFKYVWEVYFGSIAMNGSGQFIAGRNFRASAEASNDFGSYNVAGSFAVIDVTNH